MPLKRIAHAHDAFVRTVMSDPRIAREFFEAHLPADSHFALSLTYTTCYVDLKNHAAKAWLLRSIRT